jgi:hypothetical protein
MSVPKHTFFKLIDQVYVIKGVKTRKFPDVIKYATHVGAEKLVYI